MTSHTLYFPFSLSEGKEIKHSSNERAIGKFSASLGQCSPHYTLTLTGFESAEDAFGNLDKLKIALYWTALDLGCGISFKPAVQECHYPKDPVQAAKSFFGELTDRRAEVVFDGGDPAIWESSKKEIKVTAQPVRISIAYDPTRFLKIFEEGFELPNNIVALSDPKLRLGIELYFLSHFKSSDFARFLVLFTALEAAAPEIPRSEFCTKTIQKLIQDVRAARMQIKEKSSAEYPELISLEGQLNYLLKGSHGGRVREFVRSALQRDGHPDFEQVSKEIKELYDRRSRLVHEGHNDLGDGLTRLDAITRAALKASIRSRPN